MVDWRTRATRLTSVEWCCLLLRSQSSHDLCCPHTRVQWCDQCDLPQCPSPVSCQLTKLLLTSLQITLLDLPSSGHHRNYFISFDLSLILCCCIDITWSVLHECPAWLPDLNWHWLHHLSNWAVYTGSPVLPVSCTLVSISRCTPTQCGAVTSPAPLTHTHAHCEHWAVWAGPTEKS